MGPTGPLHASKGRRLSAWMVHERMCLSGDAGAHKLSPLTDWQSRAEIYMLRTDEFNLCVGTGAYSARMIRLMKLFHIIVLEQLMKTIN